MNKTIHLCDECGVEVPNSGKWTLVPVNDKYVCKTCLTAALEDRVTPGQIQQIQGLSLEDSGGDERMAKHGAESYAFCVTHMRVGRKDGLGGLTKQEAQAIVSWFVKEIERKKHWRRNNPICVQRGCDWEDLGFDGMKCRRCDKRVI